ncbi:hypothetical protein [Nitrospirillum iridis]|uniref:Transmembrane protein n=1 Tax=Nitrospirillum iridis TaxID=765888 RepID=A0A7X0EG71_9PROT|nr:hypothetical protein [Nitrospirillum iridis]MBB6253244.1 hypothetical protein [Nitrospirillum iridis]
MPAWRKPTPGYYASLGFALAGMVFVATSLAGSLQIRAHADAFSIINPVGLPVMLFVWFLLYAFRLIFWGRVPAQSQNLIRTLLTLVLCAEVIAAVIALLLAMTQPDGDPVGGQGREIMVIFFTVFGGLCQIGTVVWLLRYRKE